MTTAARLDPAARLGLVLRLAARELRGGLRGQGVFLACLVLGVGAVAVVGSLAASVEDALRADARRLLGGDLEIRTSNTPVPEAAVERLRALGVVSTEARLRTMARGAGRPTLVELKAVDGAYPLVGQAQLAGGMDLARALAGDGPGPDGSPGLPGLVAQRALMVRLEAGVGDVVRLGGADFRLTAELLAEPDRATRFFGLGPRVIAPLSAVRQAGLLGPGSVVRFSARLALPAEASGHVGGGRVEAARRIKADLEQDFPDAGWRVRTFDKASDRLERFLDEFSRYLTLVGLSSLLVGGIGVAGAVRSSLASRIGSLAAMKCLGATRSMVVSVYLARTMGLALAGSLGGAALGAAASASASTLMSAMFGVAVRPGIHPVPLILASGFGLLMALAFSLPHLSAAAAVAPSRLFRGYVDPGPRRPSRRAVLGTALTAVALCGLTLAVARDLGTALGFAGAAVGAVALFHAFARFLAWAASRMRASGPRLRQALANIHRPGASTASVVFSLGLGLTVLCAVTLVDGHMQDLVGRRMAGMAPDYFFLDIPRDAMDAFRRQALAVPGVERVDHMPVIRARITRIGDRPARVEDVAEEASWALRGDRALSFAAEPPNGTVISAGQWWEPDYRVGPGDEPVACFDADLARGFGIGVGDTLTFNVMGRELTARIDCLREIDYTTLALNAAVIFAPGALDAAPYTHLATAYARDEDAADALFDMVNRHFPAVASVYVKDVLRDVEGMLGVIGLAVRAIAAVTLAAGLLVLAEALRANIEARHYDAVVFKVLGATRQDILGALGLEFLLLGGATAVLAAILGAVASWLFVSLALHGDWSVQPLSLAVIAGGGTVVTVVLGMLGVRRALARPAWPVLKNE